MRGYDIYTDLYLTPSEAALGAKVELNGIDNAESVLVPQGVQSGEKLRIKEKGYKNGKGGRGDLIAEIKILVPKKLSKEEKELYEKLAKVTKFEPRNISNLT